MLQIKQQLKVKEIMQSYYFLYNTGARADEVAQLTIADLELAYARKRDYSYVLVKGKGNKLRRCPLWINIFKVLVPLVEGRDAASHVFQNRWNQPITGSGTFSLVKNYYHRVLQLQPSLGKKVVRPHITATHLLRAGVDINTIRAWLGHISINTTNIYAEVDLEMKTKALALYVK